MDTTHKHKTEPCRAPPCTPNLGTHQHACRPDVHIHTITLLRNLGRCIDRRPTGLCQRATAHAAAAAEIDCLDLQAVAEHDVGWLQVTIADVAPVALDQQVQHTLHDGGCLGLAACALGGEVLVQAATCAQLLHDVSVILVLQQRAKESLGTCNNGLELARPGGVHQHSISACMQISY